MDLQHGKTQVASETGGRAVAWTQRNRQASVKEVLCAPTRTGGLDDGGGGVCRRRDHAAREGHVEHIAWQRPTPGNTLERGGQWSASNK